MVPKDYAIYRTVPGAGVMKIPLLFLAIAALCFGVAFRYFRPPELSWETISSGGAISDASGPLPRLVLPNLDKEPVELSSYKGQVVFVTLWATWCGYCVQEIPTLIHLQREFEDRGFTVVAIAVDDNGEPVRSFARSRRFQVDGDSRLINYPILFGNNVSARAFGLHGLPSGILVNREGREVKLVRGTANESMLRKAIEKLVAE